MVDITKNEALAALTILKSPEVLYNANSLSKELGITPMGTLKILKKLEKGEVLRSGKIGRSRIYRINAESGYARKYVSLLLSAEAANASGLIKVWVNEIRKLRSADIAILFGSVLRKESPNDIDVLLVTDQEKFEKLQEEVEEINRINLQKLHPVYQSLKDLIGNIRKRDKVMLNAIKGIIVFGEEKFIVVYNESRRE